MVDGETTTYSEKLACPDGHVSMPELAPRVFSFNSPHGACPRCTGLGMQPEIDPDLVVPDPDLSISEGALVPWTVINSNFYEQVIQAIADRYEIDLETPWRDLREEQKQLFLRGTDGEKLYVTYRNRMGRKRSYMLAFEGIVPSLERRYQRDRLGVPEGADRGVHDAPPVPGVRRGAPEADQPGRHGRRARTSPR